MIRAAIAAGVLCIVALLAAAHHVAPFVDDVTFATSSQEDWLEYKLNALDILDNGLEMPRVNGAYFQPGGFLYNYFVALAFAVVGRNAAYVYLIHAVLLALSVVAYLAMARRHLTAPVYALFAAFLVAMLCRNVWEYVFRLLSENLVMLLIPLATIALLRARERDSLAWYGISGTLLGAVVLTRLNLQLAPLALALAVLACSGGGLRRRVLSATVLGVASCLIMSFLALRNWIAAGDFTFMTPAHAAFLPSAASIGDALRVFASRALYGVGIVTGPDITINKYLLVANAGAVANIAVAARRRKIEFVDALAAAWVLSAYVPFVFLPTMGGYGMRFQWPTAAMAALLACRFAGQVPAFVHATREAWLPLRRRIKPA